MVFKKETTEKKIYKLISKITPLNKMGESSNITKIIEFLTNDNSSYLTGLSIPVDGGAILQSPESIASLYND